MQQMGQTEVRMLHYFFKTRQTHVTQSAAAGNGEKPHSLKEKPQRGFDLALSLKTSEEKAEAFNCLVTLTCANQ